MYNVESILELKNSLYSNGSLKHQSGDWVISDDCHKTKVGAKKQRRISKIEYQKMKAKDNIKIYLLLTHKDGTWSKKLNNYSSWFKTTDAIAFLSQDAAKKLSIF